MSTDLRHSHLSSWNAWRSWSYNTSTLWFQLQWTSYQFADCSKDAVAIAHHHILQHLDTPYTYGQILFLDYRSGFNTMRPMKLTAKLGHPGLSTPTWNWILDRPHVVRMEKNVIKYADLTETWFKKKKNHCLWRWRWSHTQHRQNQRTDSGLGDEPLNTSSSPRPTEDLLKASSSVVSLCDTATPPWLRGNHCKRLSKQQRRSLDPNSPLWTTYTPSAARTNVTQLTLWASALTALTSTTATIRLAAQDIKEGRWHLTPP